MPDLTDAERLETYDEPVLAAELRRLGLPELNPNYLASAHEVDGYVRVLLRHVYNNRDTALAVWKQLADERRTTTQPNTT